MSFDYDELQAMALELVAEAGRSITISRKGRTPADANKPWLGGSGAATTWTGKGVFVELSSANRLGLMVVTQDMEKRKSRCLLVPHTGVDLATYDTVTDGTDVLRILSAQTLKPGDVVLAYFLEVAA